MSSHAPVWVAQTKDVAPRHSVAHIPLRAWRGSFQPAPHRVSSNVGIISVSRAVIRLQLILQRVKNLLLHAQRHTVTDHEVSVTTARQTAISAGLPATTRYCTQRQCRLHHTVAAEGDACSAAHFGLDVGVVLTGVGSTGGAIHVQFFAPPVVAHVPVPSDFAPVGHGTRVKLSQLAGGSCTQMPSL
eukprot:COSAG02_NODE_1581_length_11839_cov_9.055451_4_plen_187_part_00